MKTSVCGINAISAFALGCAVTLTVYLFAMSRNDPSLRIAALVSATGLVSSLTSIASTLLTGKDVTKAGSNVEIPPGSQVNAQIATPATPKPQE